VKADMIFTTWNKTNTHPAEHPHSCVRYSFSYVVYVIFKQYNYCTDLAVIFAT